MAMVAAVCWWLARHLLSILTNETRVRPDRHIYHRVIPSTEYQAPELERDEMIKLSTNNRQKLCLELQYQADK